MAFHVEHFGAAVTAEQVTTVDTNSTPVFIRVVLFPTRTACSSQHTVPFGARSLVGVSISEGSACRAAAAVLGG